MTPAVLMHKLAPQVLEKVERVCVCVRERVSESEKERKRERMASAVGKVCVTLSTLNN